MPVFVAAALVAIAPALGVTLFTVGAVAITAASILAYGIVTVGTIFGSYELNRLLNKPKSQTQSPSAVTVAIPIRQALPPRLRSYGRVKIAGTIGFEETDNGGAGVTGIHLQPSIIANTANTGNGIPINVAALSGEQFGSYTVTFTSPTAFKVYDPSSTLIGTGSVGVPFANQIGFTISAGTVPFIAGDSFAANVGQFPVGNLWLLQLTGQGEIDAVEEHWLGDDQFLLTTGNLTAVTYSGSIYGNGGFGQPEHSGYGGAIQIWPQLGTADQAAQPLLVSAFAPDYTSDFRWRGVPNVLLIYGRPVNLNQAEALYQYGPPNYRQVQRAALVYDPRDNTQTADGDPDRPRNNNWTWSENAGLVILDFLRHPDGWARWVAGDGSRRMVPIANFDVTAWQAFANLCDQTIARKGGGTQARYTLDGTYDMTGAPKDTLQGMLAACDGEIFRNGTGQISIRGGQWGPDPTVVIGDADILEHSLKPGADKFSACNWITAKFTAARNDYQQIDMDPWLDQDNIDLTGEQLVSSLDLTWCSNHSQARRIAKINMEKLNPGWSGTVATGPRGLLTYGERLITLQIPELNINGPFLVTAFEPSPTLERCQLTVQSLDSSCYDWDAESEEGTAPPIGAITINANTVPYPTGVQVTIAFDPNLEIWRATLTWENNSFITLFYEAQFKLSTDVDFTDMFVPDGALSAITDVTVNLDPLATYDFQVRSITPAGKASYWIPPALTGEGLALNYFNPANSQYLLLLQI